ncbi:MAG: hypothetical protein DWQ10_14890 [Calditrichaeota bacterium]|nr:MAG: hypothetical protein DWQ10_14890 [Calditrichota bacterium]
MVASKKILLMTLLIGLTLISLMAGFNFYETLFGLSTAIICSIVFESLRLGCLWGIALPGWSSKGVALPLYILVAGSCSFAAITQFHAEIIEQYAKERKPYEQETSRRIAEIKKAYAEQVNVKIADLEDRMNICNRKLASNPKYSYWNNRLDQLKDQHANAIAARDSFLLYIPVEKVDQWIAAQAANLGLDFQSISIGSQNSVSITTAIQELWGLSTIDAKKIVSVIIVTTTEAGIVMLSFVLAYGFVGAKSQQPHQSQPADIPIEITQELITKFSHDEINQFIQKCQTSIHKYGRLPYARELGKKQRLMRQYLIDQNMDLNELVKNDEQ